MAADVIVAPRPNNTLQRLTRGMRDAGSAWERSSACIEAIRRTPEMHFVIHESYRRELVCRFPYAVFYDYVDGTMTVYGVFHTSCYPDKWRQRLP